MRALLALLFLSSILLAMQPGIDYSKILEDYYSMAVPPTTSYTSVVRGDFDSCVKGVAWMNLLYFKRAQKSFEDCGKPDKDFYIVRMRALSGDEKAAREYISGLPDTKAGRMEKLFVEGIALGKINLDEMKKILESVEEVKDVFLFEYLYFLRFEDLESAIKMANRYLRGKDEIVVDYDYAVLKRRYYPLLLLTSKMLYDYATEGIEKVFDMKLEEFLKMDDEKRGRMILEEILFGKGSRRLKASRLALENVLDLLSYNANDYTYLSEIEDIPDLRIIDKRYIDFVSEVKKLISILKTA